MAYILGFIVADGSIQVRRSGQSLTLGIYSTDKDIVEKISSILNLRVRRWIVGKHYKDVWYLNTCHKLFITPLLEMGVSSRKSYNLGPLPIPNEWFWDFLRGFTDGDGSFSKSPDAGLQLRWEGKPEGFLSWLVSKIGEEIDPPPHVGRHYGHWVVSLNGKRAKHILDRMYKNSTLFMDRKMNVYRSLDSYS